MHRKIIIITVLSVMIVTSSVNAAFGAWEIERNDGTYNTLIDEKGLVLDQTSLPVYEGDEFIAPDNRRYKVVKVMDTTSYCKQVGTEDLSKIDGEDINLAGILGLTPVMGKNTGTIAIYHTHSDESYVPTDGTDSKRAHGGIFQVGRALRDRLKNTGIKVVQDTTPHDPHDPNAYYRSRRTASRLLRQGALALIDVHRDSAPPQRYQTKVNGQTVTRVKLVVGRQNPHMAANMAFAKRLKAYIDKNETALDGGIFIGRGNYNQDLTPRAMLIEVGADTNSRYQAQNGVKRFAAAIPKVLGVSSSTPASKPLSTTSSSRSDWTSVLWIIVAAAAIYGGYIFINRGKIGSK
ncbi:MAG: stage II sporulation protein P [Candidatus Saccharibacteria bacterium]